MKELKGICTKIKTFVQGLNEDEQVLATSAFLTTWVFVLIQPTLFGVAAGLLVGASAVIIKRNNKGGF